MSAGGRTVGGKARGLLQLQALGVPVPAFIVLAPGESADAAVAFWEAEGRPALAVRSSASAEDGADRSFAGLFHTVLGVGSAEAIHAAVAAVRASVDSARVRAYAGEAPLEMAVVVQVLVVGESSGVLFTRDPSCPDRALISASPGLCEGVVSGRVPCDTLTVDAASGAVLTHAVEKDTCVQLVDGAPAEVPVPAGRRAPPSLGIEAARELARLGWRLERDLGGRPLDIEWTVAAGRLVLLQCRPLAVPVPQGRRLLWDNSNIVESYHGPVGPLTFSFASHAYGIVYRLFAAQLGVGPAVIRAESGTFDRMIGHIQGRIYYNLNAWYRVVSLLPGYRWNRRFLEQMMGVAEVASDADAGPATGGAAAEAWRLLRLGPVFAWRALTLDRRVRAFSAAADAALRGHRAQDLGRLDGPGLLAVYQDLEARLLWSWHTPIVNDFFVMIGFGLLRSLSEKWLPGAPLLHNRLLAGEGGLDSTAPTREALALVAALRARPAADAALATHPDDTALEAIAAADPGLAAGLRGWLDRWGDRAADELKLEVPALRQRPAGFVALLRAMRAAPPLAPEALGAAEATLRADAEATVRAGLSGPRAWAFQAVLRFARTRVKDRENLRFFRTRVFGLVRDLFATLGQRMAEAGALAAPDDVWWLTVDEAWGWVRGTTPCTDLRGLAAVRRAQGARDAALPEPPTRFYTWGAVHAHNRFLPLRPPAAAAVDGALRGLGACPGLVEAEAVVVTDPSAAPPLHGRVLVTYRTDPGWVPLFPGLAALVVERGSLLSHSAVVAREFGIPTVVGVDGLLATVRTGDRLRVDAVAGTITRLPPDPA